MVSAHVSGSSLVRPGASRKLQSDAGPITPYAHFTINLFDSNKRKQDSMLLSLRTVRHSRFSAILVFEGRFVHSSHII